MSDHWKVRLTLLFTRPERPGWGRVYHLLMGSDRGARYLLQEPNRTVRGKLHGYDMFLDLRQWSHRHTYFLARYYDLTTQLLLLSVIRPGDHVVDVGANVGMITLLASRLVGPAGQVNSFEPNPSCAAQLDAMLRHNGIKNVRLHQIAAGERAAEMILTVPLDSQGEGSLAGSSSGRAVEEVTVAVEPLDTRLSSPALIKIDVEGFELAALRGMRATLTTSGPLVITEVVAHHLERAGCSTTSLFQLMQEYDYRPCSMRVHRRRKLKLVPATAESHSNNVLWYRPGSDGEARLLAARLLPA